jgi:hypothetical protein
MHTDPFNTMSSTTATYVPTADDQIRIEKLNTMALAYFQTGHNKMVGLQETSATINTARPKLYACKTLTDYRAAQPFFNKTSTANETMSFCKILLSDAQKMCKKADAIAAIGYAAVAAASSRKGKRPLAALDVDAEAVQAEAEPEPQARPSTLHFPALESYIAEVNVAAALSSPEPKRAKLEAGSATPGVDRMHSVMGSFVGMFSAALGGAAAPAAAPAQQLVQVKLEKQELVQVKLEKQELVPVKLEKQELEPVKLENGQKSKPAIPAEDFYDFTMTSDDEMQEAQTLLVQQHQPVHLEAQTLLVEHHQPVHLEARSDSPRPCPMPDIEDSDDDKPLQSAKPASKKAPAGGAAKPKSEAKPKNDKPKNATPKNDKAAASEAGKKAEKAKQAASTGVTDRGKNGKGLGKKPKVVYAEMMGLWEPEIDMKMLALHGKGYSYKAMTPQAILSLRTMPKEVALKALDEMLDTKEHIDNHNVYFTTVLDGMRKMYKVASVAQILQRLEYDDYEVPEDEQETLDESEEFDYAWNMYKDTFVDLVCERMEELNKMKRCSFGKLNGSDAVRQLQTLPAHLAADLLAQLRDETGTIADVHAYIVKNAKRLRSVHGVKAADDAWDEMEARLQANNVDRVDDTEDDADADEM